MSLGIYSKAVSKLLRFLIRLKFDVNKKIAYSSTKDAEVLGKSLVILTMRKLLSLITTFSPVPYFLSKEFNYSKLPPLAQNREQIFVDYTYPILLDLRNS